VTTTAPPVKSTETRAALLAYFDALALAEPIQARLWQLAQITLTQLLVLRELREEPRTAGRLGAKVGVSRTSITHIVDRLERRGLVSRHRTSPDRRLVEVRIEPAGERLLGEIKVLGGTNIHRAVESMSADEREQLTIGLTRLVELARALAEREE
jgi:DNA-binding MarR family transcriptional regulator